MKLTNKAIQKIKAKEIRLRLGLALGFTEQWIIQLLDRNKENGPLTTAKAMQLIRELTKLKDAEILEEETETVKNRA